MSTLEWVFVVVIVLVLLIAGTAVVRWWWRLVAGTAPYRDEVEGSNPTPAGDNVVVVPGERSRTDGGAKV
jgi:hypothetical protein